MALISHCTCNFPKLSAFLAQNKWSIIDIMLRVKWLKCAVAVKWMVPKYVRLDPQIPITLCKRRLVSFCTTKKLLMCSWLLLFSCDSIQVKTRPSRMIAHLPWEVLHSLWVNGTADSTTRLEALSSVVTNICNVKCMTQQSLSVLLDSYHVLSNSQNLFCLH